MFGDRNNPEQVLIERVKAGDQSAFGPLIAPQTGRLIMLGSRMLGSTAEAEETVQDALASVWVTRRRLDTRRAIGPYLTTIVLNKCRDRLRRRKVAGFIGIAPTLDELTAADTAPDPETIAADRDMLGKLRIEIERLPLRLREALVLVAFDGRSQSEAGELLGISEKAVESRIYRARKRLKEKIAYSEG